MSKLVLISLLFICITPILCTYIKTPISYSKTNQTYITKEYMFEEFDQYIYFQNIIIDIYNNNTVNNNFIITLQTFGGITLLCNGSCHYSATYTDLPISYFKLTTNYESLFTYNYTFNGTVWSNGKNQTDNSGSVIFLVLVVSIPIIFVLIIFVVIYKLNKFEFNCCKRRQYQPFSN